ncbi:MAG: PH domain-containing protein [Acidobacteria bacterium]|nr:PH domain-containing protein [Acidobacteriota bacterium]
MAADSRVEDLLNDGEEIVARARLHWMVYRWPFILFFYSLAMCILAFSMFVNAALAVPPALVMFASLFGAALTRLRRRATEMVLTDRRLLVMEGFVKPVDRAIRLDEIREIEAKQDPLGRSLDFGKVEVTLASGERRALSPVAEAGKFVNWVKQVADPDSEAGGPRQEPDPEPVWSVTGETPLTGSQGPV